MTPSISALMSLRFFEASSFREFNKKSKTLKKAKKTIYIYIYIYKLYLSIYLSIYIYIGIRLNISL